MSAVSADRGPQVPVPLETLAAREGVSRVWAEQVMASLRRAGIAASSRGAHGGFVLARRTEQISPGEVWRARQVPAGNLVQLLRHMTDGRPVLAGSAHPGGPGPAR